MNWIIFGWEFMFRSLTDIFNSLWVIFKSLCFIINFIFATSTYFWNVVWKKLISTCTRDGRIMTCMVFLILLPFKKLFFWKFSVVKISLRALIIIGLPIVRSKGIHAYKNERCLFCVCVCLFYLIKKLVWEILFFFFLLLNQFLITIKKISNRQKDSFTLHSCRFFHKKLSIWERIFFRRIGREKKEAE